MGNGVLDPLSSPNYPDLKKPETTKKGASMDIGFLFFNHEN